MRTVRSIVALALLVTAPAFAGSLAGVTMPDTVSVGGQSLVLNGMGLREKFYFDIYVGALYLPAATTSAGDAITAEGAKRVAMHFLYREVTAEQLVEAFEGGLANQPDADRTKWTQLFGMMETVQSGDTVVFDYVPGTGTSVTVKGVNKGTIAGAGFAQSLVAIFVGTNPPTNKLKRGMMGS